MFLKLLLLSCMYLVLFQMDEISGELSDVEYEQVISDRYLFSEYSNESSWWPVLPNVRSAWQVASLPNYHNQSSQGFWILIEKENSSQIYKFCYMSIYEKGNLIELPEILVNNNKSFLVCSNNKNRVEDYTCALISPNDIQLILCNEYDIRSCFVKRRIDFPSSIVEKTKKINCGLFVEGLNLIDYLYIGSDSGLHRLNLQTFEIDIYINEINVSVSSLSLSIKYQTIFIGTEAKLWIETFITNESEVWRFEHINALIDSPITSLVYDNKEEKLWIGQDIGITLLRPIEMSKGRIHWYFERLAGEISSPGSYDGHLPFSNITSLSITNSNPSDNCVWLASIYGLVRYNSLSRSEDTWRVFNSGRYMPNRLLEVNISSLTVLNQIQNSSIHLGSTAVAITNRGLAIIRFEPWTLAKKAEHFQKFIDESDRHVRYGLVSDCTMSKWGDPTTCVKGPNDNDGLWTSMYLSSQIFRYVVTNDTNVKQKAWTFFKGLSSLNHVTGISGYPSRSIARVDEFPPTSGWYPSPVNSTLQYRGDTSSDEIVGHEFVYPLVHDLLAENAEERLEAYDLLLNITRHIINHNWYLIGELGNHTTWGIWNPNEINNNSFYQESRGLNSLQILAFLLETYVLSADQTFLNGTNILIDKYSYDINLINQKIIAVCDVDYSDDELAYLAYFNLIYAFDSFNKSNKFSPKEKESFDLIINDLKEYLFIGLELSHRYKQMEKSPFYNFIYCYLTEHTNRTKFNSFDCQSLSNDSIWYMQRFPLELINWPQYNTIRLDVQLNQPASCSSNNKYSLKLLPADERNVHKWNGGPFDLDQGNGFYEDDPTIFLIGYWGMRYLHLLGP